MSIVRILSYLKRVVMNYSSQTHSVTVFWSPVSFFHVFAVRQSLCIILTNTRHSPNVVSMLAHRLRRWPNIETASGECLEFAAITVPAQSLCFCPWRLFLHSLLYRTRHVAFVTARVRAPPLSLSKSNGLPNENIGQHSVAWMLC